MHMPLTAAAALLLLCCCSGVALSLPLILDCHTATPSHSGKLSCACVHEQVNSMTQQLQLQGW